MAGKEFPFGLRKELRYCLCKHFCLPCNGALTSAPLCRHHPDVHGLVDSTHFVNIQQAYEVLIGRSRGKETDGRGTSAGAGWSFHDWCAACSVCIERSASLSSVDPCLLISRGMLCVSEVVYQEGVHQAAHPQRHLTPSAACACTQHTHLSGRP